MYRVLLEMSGMQTPLHSVHSICHHDVRCHRRHRKEPMGPQASLCGMGVTSGCGWLWSSLPLLQCYQTRNYFSPLLLRPPRYRQDT